MDRLLREGNPPAGQLASPKPQYKKPGVDEYAPVEGQHGAPFATLKDASGNVVSPATDAKLEQVKSELELVKSELEAIKANQLSGDQKVQLSGTNVLIASGASFEVAPGSASPTQAGAYDYKNFTWLYVRVLAQSGHEFEVEQEVTGYTRLKIAGKKPYSSIFLSDPIRPMGTIGKIWIRNTSLDPQKYGFQIFGMTG